MTDYPTPFTKGTRVRFRGNKDMVGTIRGYDPSITEPENFNEGLYSMDLDNGRLTFTYPYEIELIPKECDCTSKQLIEGGCVCGGE
jgi:hypothetical protein